MKQTTIIFLALTGVFVVVLCIAIPIAEFSSGGAPPEGPCQPGPKLNLRPGMNPPNDTAAQCAPVAKGGANVFTLWKLKFNA